ncbi:MAG: hypothetical protein WCP57_02945 [Bacteroidota bacterium]
MAFLSEHMRNVNEVNETKEAAITTFGLKPCLVSLNAIASSVMMLCIP